MEPTYSKENNELIVTRTITVVENFSLEQLQAQEADLVRQLNEVRDKISAAQQLGVAEAVVNEVVEE